MPASQSPSQTARPQAPSGFGGRLLDLAALLLILGFGCWFWLYFFGYGRLVLSFEDWPIQAYYLDITRLGLSHGQIPWICNFSAHATDKFLVLPETLMAPQILLLPWMSNGGFVAFNVCLLYSAGVWGWWELKRALHWSREAFLLAAVAASFNGYVVAHLTAGHLMWCGCFLASWMLLGLQKILNPEAPRFAWLPLAFSLFALFLLGAFHIAIGWIFFIGMAALVRPKAIRPAFYAVLGACLMGLFRILPAKLFIFEKFTFLTGYPSLRTLLESFTTIKGYTPGTPSDSPLTADQLGWWEFNHYTGWALLLFVLLGALGALVLWRKKIPFALPVAGASLGMAILSYGSVYALLYPIPLFQTERVATRLVALSFVGLLFLAVSGLETLKTARGRFLVRLLYVGLLAFVLCDFWAGTQPWLLCKLEPAYPFSYYFPDLEKLAPALLPKAHQLGYKTAVITCALFSLGCVVGLGVLFWQKRGADSVKG